MVMQNNRLFGNVSSIVDKGRENTTLILDDVEHKKFSVGVAGWILF